MNKVHYRKLEFIFSACGIMWIPYNKITNRRKRVTCENCKQTKLFRKVG